MKNLNRLVSGYTSRHLPRSNNNSFELLKSAGSGSMTPPVDYPSTKNSIKNKNASSHVPNFGIRCRE